MASREVSAQASCNTIPNPPAPAPIQSTLSGQTFPYQANGPAFGISGNGQAGCNATTNTANGGQGVSGAGITATYTGLTFVGGTVGQTNNLGSNAVSLTSNGGSGGGGGPGTSSPGGQGGHGADGGLISTVANVGLQLDRNGQKPGIGIFLSSMGGDGGGGGSSSLNSGNNSQYLAGSGGIAGQGGTISASVGGTIIGSSIGIYADTSGGLGGIGGYGNTRPGLTGVPGSGGNGGDGGSSAIGLEAGTVNNVGTDFGVWSRSQGGGGGSIGNADLNSANGSFAASAGVGGSAAVIIGPNGTVTLNNVNPFSNTYSLTAAVHASADGGFGGSGTTGSSGDGGDGGRGGLADVSVLGRVVYIGPPTPANGSTTSLFSGQGVYAHANGGEGGPGGSGFLAGSSAQGGRVLLNLSGPGLPSSTGGQSPQPVYAIDASGYYAHGALLQAIGGAGESAGSSQNLFLGLGAPGADGGNGGRIEVRSNNANVITRGANSFGIIAQSIGGNGGNGGDVTVAGGIATVAIGGAGRRGGNADLVNLDLTGGLIASTSTIGGGGILAQSLGGGGGAGGTAVSTTVGTFSLSVGGKAGAGGTGSDVTINNGALISTQGDHAAGIHAQSIGGSGGKGGSGISLSASLVSVSVGVGGEGGDGQSAGNVSVTNTSSGQITTYGPDAYGIHAQSIGGGGGVGGAALARALALGPGGDIPSIALSFPVGGKGGSGSLGGLVKLDNAGLITTIGDGATGIMAQSIGGGGGAGGDASATAAASTFGENGVAITLGVTIGGKGAGGGKSDAVSVTIEPA